MTTLTKRTNQRKIYHRLKAEGICTKCHNEPAIKNRILGLRCTEKERKRYLRYNKKRKFKLKRQDNPTRFYLGGAMQT